MVLQRIVYPTGATFEEDMYIRRDWNGVALIGEERTMRTFDNLNVVKFDTYFNTFSLAKWKKYTNLDRVMLRIDIQGKARITLTQMNLHGFDVDEYIVHSQIVSGAERTTFTIPYPPCDGNDALSFRIRPLEKDLHVYGGAYITDMDEAALPEVNIALAICTYKREDYIANNLEMLQRHVFGDETSFLRGHVRVYISDNGQTLDAKALSNENVRIFPNKNSGGSGGFSRGAIQAMSDPTYEPTHIILMDDDITFDQYALERTYSFLRLMKPEYHISLLGGAMFRTDRRFIQHAAGETHTLSGITFNKAGYNMYNILDIMRNEVEEKINYLGWWYCCIPVDLFKKRQYSLPLFVQYDDIEFSLRNNDVPKITLNGICVWHIPFDKKWSGMKNYYTIRNRAIVNCMYFDGFTKKWFKRQLFRECVRKTLQYSFKEANLALMAAEDFLKGMSWLREQDPVALNTAVSAMSDKLQPLERLPILYDPRKLKRNDEIDTRQWRRLFRWMTLNGWLLPANRTAIVEIDNPQFQFLFRVRGVLKYDDATSKGIVVEKSYREAFRIARRLLKVFGLIDLKFNQVVQEYQKTHDEVISEEFWKRFLNF